MFLKYQINDVELKPCPFCSGTNLTIGVSFNPFIVWDDAVRGESVAYVVCSCGAMLKQDINLCIDDVFDDEEDIAELKEDLIKCTNAVANKWNNRQPIDKQN